MSFRMEQVCELQKAGLPIIEHRFAYFLSSLLNPTASLKVVDF